MALERAVRNGWKDVKILFDAKSVIDMIQKKNYYLMGHLKLSVFLDHVDFVYIPRSLNKTST